MVVIQPVPSERIPILLYHDLESAEQPNEKQGAATRGTVVRAGDFQKHIQCLHDNGYQTLSLRQYSSSLLQGIPLPPKKLILTFDDGHISNYSLAFPILKQYGFTASFFVVTDKINTDFHLSEEEILEMHRAGMEFGSHGASHTFLPLLPETKLKEELVTSKKRLEKLLKNEIQFLAFPGGHYNKKVVTAGKMTGYKGACSCLQGLNHSGTDLFRLRRIEIRSGFQVQDFRTLFNPLNITMYQVIDTLKAALRHSVGLNTYAEIRKKMYKFYKLKR